VAFGLAIAGVIGGGLILVDRYALGGIDGGGNPIVRLFGRVLGFGGLGALALSFLSLHPVVVIIGAAAFAGIAGWLGIVLDGLGPTAPTPIGGVDVEGSVARVVEEVGRDSGQIMVDDGTDRWYLAARPFQKGIYPVETTVVIVGMRHDMALVAAPQEIGR
jgi:hypothetical protein